jgi:hypothetical protein
MATWKRRVLRYVTPQMAQWEKRRQVERSVRIFKLYSETFVFVCDTVPFVAIRIIYPENRGWIE